jgi:hypothetical protein
MRVRQKAEGTCDVGGQESALPGVRGDHDFVG